MKIIYPLAVLFLITSLAPNTIFAQCEDVTIESLTNPGPYEVATLTEDDGIRNGPDYLDATVYYPTNATPPYASIAIVPGFTAQPSSVEEWGPFYASHGIVTIIIGTNSPFEFPDLRATALLDALETLRQENERQNSPLENQLDVDKFAVSGWSMGGGGAQLAAQMDSSIKAVLALCPWYPQATFNHNSPVLIFSGQDDTVAPPGIHADVHYNVTPDTTNKLLFEVANGSHSVANTPTGGDGVVGKIALSWLKLYLDDNDCYCPLLTDSLLVDPPAASKVEASFECEPIIGIAENNIDISIFPNPTDNFITVSIPTIASYKVYSALGQLLLSGEIDQSNKQIDFSQFAKGMYYVRVENETIRIIRK
ncbi:poly(ethylene terephthalate) hydrolase family protein [Aequorivita viscosa]|uniref:Por secretion system C-terminal sorting domain-containing protein n=1 Tax=Aequorivita viscosa TaxID=797419 RepID=A0A1M6F5V0_9FLAO|nr:T9SS type A sorting domain-containing protein [Aequorivita viscosa]SDW65268.1 Por secretion system C-terminal sorting domain-containing protein [Aequorivita viscosa]SHI93077.1 Por secretion system C-terminal sorting domain-containing protein [Aequorivita viscosa]